MYFHGSLSCIHWLLICGSLKTQLRHLLPQGLPSLSFKHQQLLTEETRSITQAHNATKLPLERRWDSEALRANGWEIKVGRGEEFLVLKYTVTQSAVQISSVLTLHQASVHATECSEILQSVTLEKYLQRISVFYTVPAMLFSSPCWTYNKPPSFTETEFLSFSWILLLSSLKAKLSKCF